MSISSVLTYINDSRICGMRNVIVRALTVLGFAATMLLPQVSVNGAGPGEAEIKAACVYNFAKFVEWPGKAFQGDSSPLVIGVIGSGRICDILQNSISGKTANGRKISVKHFRSSREIRDCQILFICSSEERRLDSILAAVSGQPVLTVGEIGNFARNGGIVNLFLDNNNVRFEINANIANHAGLKISSQLLKLAKIVNN